MILSHLTKKGYQMITIDEKIPLNKVPEWDKLAAVHGRDKVLMFDLETTGLSPKNSFIYIIGINIWKEDHWEIRQLFNDDGRSEPAMLSRFMELLEDKTVLYHFNGDTFDIPFVRGRMEKVRQSLGIDIPDRMSTLRSVDFLKEIRPFKYALGLPNVKQKTVEQYLGIHREDRYNGGQLIGVYLNYLSSGNRRNRDLVLLHNRDDMEGMFHLARMSALSGLLAGDFRVGDLSMEQKGNVLCLNIPMTCEDSLPCPMVTTGDGMMLRGEGTLIALEIRIRQEPCRCQVTRELESGFYLPCAGYTGATLYEDPAHKKDTYIAADDNLLGNPEHLRAYATCCIQKLMTQRPRAK